MKHVEQGGAGTCRRRRVDAESAGQLVGRLEADAPDVRGKTVRVLADDAHSLVAVGLVDADGPLRAEAVRLEEEHDVADGLLLAPALADLGDPLRADSLHFLEERRAFVDDLKRPLAEDLDDLAGVARADALDEAGGEVFLDAGDGRRRRAEDL